MKGKNKGFVIAMITTSFVVLVVLMVMMFLGVKYYLGQGNKVTTKQEDIKQEQKVEDVKYSSTSLILINELTDEELRGFDIDNTRSVVRNIKRTTKISDAYGKTIPLSSIQKGDIVEVVYEEDAKRTESISKTQRAWTKKEVNGLKVDDTNKQAKLFGVTYTYDERLLVLGQDDEVIKVTDISEYDIVTVQGLEDKIYSIKVEKAAGRIHIVDIPSADGRVEIDINTMIPLKDISEPIEVIAGKHKVGVSIKGYESFVQEVEVEPGKTLEVSLDNTKRIYSNVNVVLTNSDVANYTVKVGDTTYNKGDKISVPQGRYDVIINAIGYHPWTKTMTFVKGNNTIKATLKSEEKEEETTSTTTGNTATGSTTTGNTTAEENNNQEAVGDTKTINIATDPSGATVYINGVNKGTTPYKATLPVGSYSILFEKEGYEIYNTSIILDGSDDQTSFLYVLTPNA